MRIGHRGPKLSKQPTHTLDDEAISVIVLKDFFVRKHCWSWIGNEVGHWDHYCVAYMGGVHYYYHHTGKHGAKKRSDAKRACPTIFVGCTAVNHNSVGYNLVVGDGK